MTEMAAEADAVQWVVLGIGVNLNSGPQDFPEELRSVATSLSIERAQPVPRALFAAALLTRLEEWLDRHAEEGFLPIRAAWSERSVTLGRMVQVRTGDGDIEGLAESIDGAGALLVRTGDRLERVLAGDVVLSRSR